MTTPDFAKCTQLATELLYKQNLMDRTLDIRELDYGDKKIYFDTIQNYATETNRPLSDFYSKDKPMLKDGCLLIYGDLYIILYNNEIAYWEHLNWTLAHEIGHIYMEHKQDGPTEEIEAHFFAAQLFMPEYSLYMMEKEYEKPDVNDLCEIFGVSPEAAQKRLETMEKKCSVRKSCIDKKIWEHQKARVSLYYRCNKNARSFRGWLNMAMLPPCDAISYFRDISCYPFEGPEYFLDDEQLQDYDSNYLYDLQRKERALLLYC